jgi:hypothetical protein
LTRMPSSAQGERQRLDPPDARGLLRGAGRDMRGTEVEYVEPMLMTQSREAAGCGRNAVASRLAPTSSSDPRSRRTPAAVSGTVTNTVATRCGSVCGYSTARVMTPNAPSERMSVGIQS